MGRIALVRVSIIVGMLCGLFWLLHGRKVEACGSAAGEPHVVPVCTSMPLSGGDHDDVLPGAGRGPTSVGRDSGEIAEVQRAWWRANECYAMLGHSKPGPDGPNIRLCSGRMPFFWRQVRENDRIATTCDLQMFVVNGRDGRTHWARGPPC